MEPAGKVINPSALHPSIASALSVMSPAFLIGSAAGASVEVCGPCQDASLDLPPIQWRSLHTPRRYYL